MALKLDLQMLQIPGKIVVITSFSQFVSYSPTLTRKSTRPVNKSSAVFARLLKNQLLYRNVIYLIWKPWYSAFMSQKAKGFGFQIKLPHALKWNSITFIKIAVVFLFVDYTPCPSGS